MATSGTDTFSMTAREIITFALRKIRVVAGNATPTAQHASGAMQELNMMLKSWMKYESLWRIKEESVPLIANTPDYTLTTQKPHRVTSARYSNASGQVMPMVLMTREEYFDLPIRTNTGTPTQYYVDYQRDAAVLYVWPVLASATTEAVTLTCFRKFEDVTSLDQTIDIRQEHFECVGYNLAVRLMTTYGRTGTAAFPEVKELASGLLQEALDEDREDTIRFVPGYGVPG